MAKVSYVSIPSGMESDYSKVLMPGDRFVNSHVKVKRLFLSRVRQKHVSQISLFPVLSPVWAAFSDPQRAAWLSAGTQSNMSGWRAFVKDTAARIANSISGYATPSDIYQALVGRMTVSSPATGLVIEQLHPSSYWINKKVVGTKTQYTPFLISELLTMPIDIAISYKSVLTAAGGSPRARFYIKVMSSYQGTDLENICEIPFSLSHDWERLTASITGVIGQFRGYTAYVEINDCTGDLYFDNVEIKHGGLNWARDPQCNSIQTTFTKAFYQIPKNWIGLPPLTNTFYRSVYYN